MPRLLESRHASYMASGFESLPSPLARWSYEAPPSHPEPAKSRTCALLGESSVWDLGHISKPRGDTWEQVREARRTYEPL
jgi:hypothetical protein